MIVLSSVLLLVMIASNTYLRAKSGILSCYEWRPRKSLGGRLRWLSHQTHRVRASGDFHQQPSLRASPESD